MVEGIGIIYSNSKGWIGGRTEQGQHILYVEGENGEWVRVGTFDNEEKAVAFSEAMWRMMGVKKGEVVA